MKNEDSGPINLQDSRRVSRLEPWLVQIAHRNGVTSRNILTHAMVGMWAHFSDGDITIHLLG